MKIFYMLPLVGAIAALSACSPAPVKQELVPVAVPAPAPQPLVLRKVDAEATAPHYRFNPEDFDKPLNPILVEKIRVAFTPKIINPATGQVITFLPILVPNVQNSSSDLNTNPNPMDSMGQPTNSADGSAANGSAINNVVDPNAIQVDSTGMPITQQQDTQAALLQIDPSLQLNSQAIASLADNKSAAMSDSGLAATDSVTDNAPAIAPSVATTTISNTTGDASTILATLPLTAKIMIAVHQQEVAKKSGEPAPSADMLDVTDIDKDLLFIEGKARHYPVYFTDKAERRNAERTIKLLTRRLDMLAVDPRASYELLLRAMKAHVLARNMDAGPDSAFKSGVYIQRLLKLRPNDPETSFWYGFSLSEGGAFRESIPYLNVALKADYQEAYLSLAHSYLQMEDPKNALTMLGNYKIKYPDQANQTDLLIADISTGKRYSVW